MDNPEDKIDDTTNENDNVVDENSEAVEENNDAKDVKSEEDEWSDEGSLSEKKGGTEKSKLASDLATSPKQEIDVEDTTESPQASTGILRLPIFAGSGSVDMESDEEGSGGNEKTNDNGDGDLAIKKEFSDDSMYDDESLLNSVTEDLASGKNSEGENSGTGSKVAIKSESENVDSNNGVSFDKHSPDSDSQPPEDTQLVSECSNGEKDVNCDSENKMSAEVTDSHIGSTGDSFDQDGETVEADSEKANEESESRQEDGQSPKSENNEETATKAQEDISDSDNFDDKISDSDDEGKSGQSKETSGTQSVSKAATHSVHLEEGEIELSPKEKSRSRPSINSSSKVDNIKYLDREIKTKGSKKRQKWDSVDKVIANPSDGERKGSNKERSAKESKDIRRVVSQEVDRFEEPYMSTSEMLKKTSWDSDDNSWDDSIDKGIEMDYGDIFSRREKVALPVTEFPRISRKLMEQKKKEQDPGLIITVEGDSENRSVLKKKEGQESSKSESSEKTKQKDSSKSRNRSSSKDEKESVEIKKEMETEKESRKNERSRHRRDKYRSRSRSRERKRRSRSRERKEKSRSSRHDRSRSREKRRSRSGSGEHSKSREKRSRSREKRRSRSRSRERTHKKHKRDRSRERDSKHSRSPARKKEKDLFDDKFHKKESKVGIKRMHDGGAKTSYSVNKKMKPLATETIVILSDEDSPDEHETPQVDKYSGSPESNKTSSKPQVIDYHHGQNVKVEDVPDTRAKPNQTVEPKSEENAIPSLVPSIPQNNVVPPQLTETPLPDSSKSLSPHLLSSASSVVSGKASEFMTENEYDPAFPTDDMEECSPTPDQPILLEEVSGLPPATFAHIINNNFPTQRLSPMPPHAGPPPGPRPGLLGEGGTLLLPPGAVDSSGLIQQPQNMSHLPLQFGLMPPGFQPGMPPQRQVIMNPMFLNRPGPFARLPRVPPGHPLQPQFGIQVSSPAGMMPNQFGHRLPPGGIPGQPELVNGGFEHMPPDSHHHPVHSVHILPNDPRGDPRLHHHPPHPESQVVTMAPDPAVMPLTLPEGVPMSVAASEHQAELLPSQAQLDQLSRITKILNSQAQLAMLSNKDSKQSQDMMESKPSEEERGLFKVPLPPVVASNHKAKSASNTSGNGDSKDNENMEMVDMDMSSPLDDDDGNIEIPTSSSSAEGGKEKPVLSSVTNESGSGGSSHSKKKDRKDRKSRHQKENSGKVRFKDEERKRKSDSAEVKNDRDKTVSSSSSVSVEKSFDEYLDDLTGGDEMPSSAVELTNKEKYFKKLHLQERVVDELKLALKPFYSSKKINKDQYKDILRRAVPKVCHSKSGDINPVKIRNLVEAYVDKLKRSKSKDGLSLGLMANGERVKTKKL